MINACETKTCLGAQTCGSRKFISGSSHKSSRLASVRTMSKPVPGVACAGVVEQVNIESDEAVRAFILACVHTFGRMPPLVFNDGKMVGYALPPRFVQDVVSKFMPSCGAR